MKLLTLAKRNCLVLFYFVFLFAFIPTASVASVYGFGNAGKGNTCVAGAMGILEDNDYYGCWWVAGSSGANRALVKWGQGQKFSSGATSFGYTIGFEKSYIPFGGLYTARMYFCPSEGLGVCTISASTEFLDSANTVYLSSSTLLVDQNPNFGGFNGIASTGSNACYVFRDPTGSEWKSNGEFFCADARELPDEPAFCYFNMNKDFDVNMGSLERSEIATTPKSSYATVNKKVDVICSGDFAVDVKIQFDFVPLSISGIDTINTSATGVGIALRFNNQTVSPTSIFSENYEPGDDSITLDFEALRDPSQSVADIPTGGFTAQAVMIVTQQ